MKSYATFDFGRSYFRDVSVIQLVKEKMPVSISLGLWVTLMSYLVSIPLGIRKAVRDGERFDTWTSGALVIGYAIPGFLFAMFLLVVFAGGSFFQWFPLARPDRRQLEPAVAVRQGPRLLLAPDAAADRDVAERLRHADAFLTKNSFLDEINKQYVMTARAKGLAERQVLYGHVFRNAMLIVIAGFPGGVHPRLLRRLADHREHLLARRPRPAGLREPDRPRLSGDLRHALHLLADRAGGGHPLRPDCTRWSTRASTSKAGRSERWTRA